MGDELCDCVSFLRFLSINRIDKQLNYAVLSPEATRFKPMFVSRSNDVYLPMRIASANALSSISQQL